MPGIYSKFPYNAYKDSAESNLLLGSVQNLGASQNLPGTMAGFREKFVGNEVFTLLFLVE